MLIQNADHSASTVVLPGGRAFDSLGAGVFDLPEDVAALFLPFPGWSAYEGAVTDLVPGLLEPVTTDEEKRRWEREATELAGREPEPQPRRRRKAE